MKRRLLIIAIFLLLGAVVNVAVAWICAVAVYSNTASTFRRGFVYTSTDLWEISVERWRGFMSVSSSWKYRRDAIWEPRQGGDLVADIAKALPSWASSARPMAVEDTPEFVLSTTSKEAAGWPFLALYHERYIDHTKAGQGYVVAGGIVVGFIPPLDDVDSPPFPKVLPLRPVWPGFVVNTLFYAAILWLLIAGPFALRRFLRVRRGLCPKCAYPMGESSVCTECGMALPSRIRVT